MESKKIVVKFKPVYNFQSAEFEMEIDISKATDYEDAMKVYNRILTELMIIAPEQSKIASTSPKQAYTVPVRRASPSQKQVMDRYGIYYDDTTTYDEADTLIKQSMKGL